MQSAQNGSRGSCERKGVREKVMRGDDRQEREARGQGARESKQQRSTENPTQVKHTRGTACFCAERKAQSTTNGRGVVCQPHGEEAAIDTDDERTATTN